MNANKVEKQKNELISRIKALEQDKMTLEGEKDRLEFKVQEALTEQAKEFRPILIAKSETKKNILKKIEKNGKQEKIITKVL